PPIRTLFPYRRSSDLATQQKTIIADHKYDGEIFFKNIGFVADTVIIDPEYWLISANNITTKITSQNGEKNSVKVFPNPFTDNIRSEEHTSELQSRENL